MLPLFPANSVLFPGEETTLRVAGAGPQALLRDCLRGDGVLGVVYCDNPGETEAMVLGTVGCRARVIDHVTYEDGVQNVVVFGEERFRLGTPTQGRDYLVCPKPEIIKDSEDLPDNHPLIHTTEKLLTIYHDVLADIDPSMLRRLPTLPLRRGDSFRVIETIMLPERLREKALGCLSVKGRFELAASYLRIEIERLRFLLGTEEEEAEAAVN